MDLFSTARGVGRVFLGLSASAALAAMLAGCGRDAEPEAGEGPQLQLPIAQPFEVARAGAKAEVEFWVKAEKEHPRGQDFFIGYWLRYGGDAPLSTPTLETLEATHVPVRLRVWKILESGERRKIQLMNAKDVPGSTWEVKPLVDDVSHYTISITPDFAAARKKGYWLRDNSIKIKAFSFASAEPIGPGRYMLELEVLGDTPALAGLSPELVITGNQVGK